MRLEEKISLYGKEDLKAFAYDIGLSKLSKLRKAELVDLIVRKLLDPEVMFYRMSIFDDRALRLFEKGIENPYEYQYDELDNACIFDEMDYAVVEGDTFCVFKEVAEAWKAVRNDKFEAYRKRAAWVWKCLYWTEEMYGVTPAEHFLEVVNSKKSFRMDESELIDIFDRFPADRLWTYRIDDYFISSIFARDIDALKRLKMIQADKSYYVPTSSEVEELFDTGALLSTPSYQKMKRFITNQYHIPKMEVEDILLELWERLSSYDDPQDAVQWFWDQFEIENEVQFNQLASLYMPVSNGTRMLMNRGHTPAELSRNERFGPGNMPIITAGSSDAARLLKEAGPQIQKMGFEIDLESNAASIPTMSLLDGVDGNIQMVQRKIYPNDPCPCGSGKKYKKCCGRNT